MTLLLVRGMKTNPTDGAFADGVQRFIHVDDLRCPRCGCRSLTSVPRGHVPRWVTVHQYTCDQCHASIAKFHEPPAQGGICAV